MKGGARPGAGRPALPDGKKKVPISARISAELLAWIDKQPGSRSAVIEAAVEKARKR